MPNEKRSLEKLIDQAKRHRAAKSPAEQLEASLRRVLYMQDPVLFCREVLNFYPDPWQESLLRSQERKIIVNVARQSGKSTTTAAKAVHRAVLWPKSLILVVAPAVPQAGELRRKIDEHVSNAREVEVTTREDNKRTLEFSNGSRIVIVAADQDTVRSYSAVSMIIEDESATVPDEVYETMEPMLLVSQGQHILLGTPKGMKGHFATIWHEATGWDKYEVTAWHNPRVKREALEALREEKANLGRLWWFQQEYECSFIAAAQGLVYPFDKKKNLAPALSRERGWNYVLGIDYGFNDSTAFVVLGWQKDDPNVYVIESFDKRGLTPAEAGEIALGFTKKYPFARMVADTGGLGKGYVEEARRRFKLPLEPAEKNNKRGYIELMTGDMRAGLLKLFPGNERLIEEWRTLPWDEEREAPADGFKDHLADACLYAWRATYSYLESIRAASPRPGTPEALQAEADALFEQRLHEVQKEAKDWWDQDREAGWLEQAIGGSDTWLN